MFTKTLLLAAGAVLMLSGCVESYAKAYGKCGGDEGCAVTRIARQQAVQDEAVNALAAAAVGAAVGYAGGFSTRDTIAIATAVAGYSSLAPRRGDGLSCVRVGNGIRCF